MISLALIFATSCFTIGFGLNIVRLLTAQAMTDRLLAVDTMVVNAAALLVLSEIGAPSYSIEIALLLAFTGFISTVAFCKYLLRGRIIE